MASLSLRKQFVTLGYAMAPSPGCALMTQSSQPANGENIEMMEMVPVPHSKAFEFVVKDFMGAWARHTVSFLVDSTCEYFKYPSFPILNKL